MTTKDLDAILEVAQTHNFNRAAENLFMAQSTLSYHIKAVEDELGFAIFARDRKGAALTPAGEQFCVTLRNVRQELKNAVEQAQNFSARYAENISIGMPVRSAIYGLPRLMRRFAQLHPAVSITPVYSYANSIDQFLKGETDILFALETSVRHISDIQIQPFYNSPIYLITLPDDPLAKKERVTAEDLAGRTLMIGGGSPPALKKVQQRIIAGGGVNYFNSADHETTLTNVAAEKGVCLSPGFLNNHNPEFAWTPFDCKETISCVLCTHREDQRPIVREFVALLREHYKVAC